MPSLPALLAQLRTKGVELSLSGDQLRYRAAAGSLDDETKALVRARREEIVQFLRAREAAQRPPLARATVKIPSFGQKLWWKWITDAQTPPPPQLIHVVKTCSGIDAATMDRAIRQLLVRYSNLLSRFEVQDNDLVIRLNDPGDFQVETEHLDAPGVSSIEDLAGDRMRAFAARNMLVSDTWLVRAKIWTAGDSVAAVLSVNHLLIDGPSQAILSAALDGILHPLGISSSQPAEDFGFFDYTQWEHDWFYARGRDLVDYWRRWSASMPVLQVPGSRQDIVWRPGTRIPHSFVLPGRVTDRVRVLAAELSTTRFLVYFTAFSIAIARWTGQQRFAIRSAGDGRMQDRQLLPIVGCMTMADPVEIDLDRSAPFAQNLKAIEREYRSAWQMRLPSLHAYPPYVVDPADAEDIPNKFAIQINYHPPGAAGVLPGAPDRNSPWPPVITRLEALTWTHPVLAIALDIMDQDGEAVVGGYFRFNSSVLSESDCALLTSAFFDVLSEYVL